MDSTTPSVFDLSPAEKLQLVQDLWDDLAACPESVPVYDWQKEALERRKANLQVQPAPISDWSEFRWRGAPLVRGETTWKRTTEGRA